MRSLRYYRPHLLVAALVLIALSIYEAPKLCSVPDRRAPGPFLVYMISDGDDDVKVSTIVSRFKSYYPELEFKVEFKNKYDILTYLRDSAGLETNPVDVVELELFNLAEAAPLMADLSGIYTRDLDPDGFIKAGLDAGYFQGKTLFIPWRLSWPALVIANDYADRAPNWSYFRQLTRELPGRVLFPALNDRELTSLGCAVIWSNNGNPADPDNRGVREAFDYFASLAENLAPSSLVTKGGDVAALAPEERPLAFIEWPEGLIPLLTEAAIPLQYTAVPLPSGSMGRRGVMPFGRFLGMPAKAAHREDAILFFAHLNSGTAQSEVIYASPWLPAAKSGWGDMGIRKEAYVAFQATLDSLSPPPPDLDRVERALPKVIRKLLEREILPTAAVDEYRDLMRGEER